LRGAHNRNRAAAPDIRYTGQTAATKENERDNILAASDIPVEYAYEIVPQE
jgi:hypothetical protein